MRMIDQKKVITALKCCKDVHQSGRWASGCISCGYADKHRPDCFLMLADDAVELLKEQETGHWIFLTDCSNSGVYCSECNTKVFDSYPFKKKLSYFCPHCGTRMEGEIERR